MRFTPADYTSNINYRKFVKISIPMNCSKIILSVTLFLVLFSYQSMAQVNVTFNSSNDDYAYVMTPTKSTSGFSHNFDIVFGYINKSWRCTYQSGTQREDFFGDPDKKYIHGFQMGALYTPISNKTGLGLRTGLVLENYVSKSKWIIDWCDHFSELDLYVPLHAAYCIPFGSDVALNLYGGIGFQWAIVGSYNKQEGYYQKWGRRPQPYYKEIKRQEYGNGWPQRVNWQGELGFNLRIKSFSIGFGYSLGLNEHGIQNTFDDGQTYETAIKSRQDKMNVTFAILL